MSSCCPTVWGVARRLALTTYLTYSPREPTTKTELSDLTITPITVHPHHTHSDTMASKSAVPSHLKAENGSDRHHGKTQSHVVRTEHAFFSFSSCRYGAGKGGSRAAAEWQWATEHDSSKNLRSTVGDDGRILCMQKRHARPWHLVLFDTHIRPGRRLTSHQLRLADEPEWFLPWPHVNAAGRCAFCGFTAFPGVSHD